jgi:hypothetical protein
MVLNRRIVFRLLAAAGASASVGDAQPPAPPQPAPSTRAAQPTTAGADLQASREALRMDAQRIGAVKLPRATEPSFRFRA